MSRGTTPHPQAHVQQNPHPNNPAQRRRPKPQPRVSSAIVGGTDRLIALFEEEQAKLETRYKQQLFELKECFQNHQAGATERHRLLTARVHELEAKLEGGDRRSLEQGREGIGTRINEHGAASDSATQSIGAASGPNTTSHIHSVHTAPSSSSNLEHLTDDTEMLLRQFAAHMKQGAAAPKQDSLGGTEPNSVKVGSIPDVFIPALAQYLASHKKALLEVSAKHRAAEEGRDALRIKFKAKLKAKRSAIRCLEARIRESQGLIDLPGLHGLEFPSDSDSEPEPDLTRQQAAVAEPALTCVAPEQLTLKRNVAVADSSTMKGTTKRPRLDLDLRS
ncbi:hypothetical protein D9615_005982 [Tricholomella constricta]|uniref:Uncharacterized protein n=1 Tax=Tricholomella constricta TaxID=117010 RepID=A0A8H5H9L0_9AGAR|nr:hypothetical protein D9615_005982 [Tricholomella constricta]